MINFTFFDNGDQSGYLTIDVNKRWRVPVKWSNEQQKQDAIKAAKWALSKHIQNEILRDE